MPFTGISRTGRDAYETQETEKINELYYTGDQISFTYVYYTYFDYPGTAAVHPENQSFLTISCPIRAVSTPLSG